MAAGWELALARDSHPVRLRAIKYAESTARRVTPIDTGDLQATVEGEAERDTMACRLSAGNERVDYAAVVEVGGRPHVIRAHGPWPLRSAEGVVFGPEVHHPGTPPQPYLRPGVSAIGSFPG